MALEKKNDLIDGINIFLPEGHHAGGIGREAKAGLVDPVKKVLQSLAAEQSDGDLDTEVALKGGDVFGVQETFQVGGGRVRRIKLCERRRNQEHGNTQGMKFEAKLRQSGGFEGGQSGYGEENRRLEKIQCLPE